MEELVLRDQVWVIGYFHRRNLGDDVFAWLYSRLLPQLCPGVEVVVVNSDSVPLTMPPPSHVRAILVGGGDVINDYFSRKMKFLLENPANRTCPIYAIGVGLPYPQMVAQGALDWYDFIVHRSAADHDDLVRRYGEEHVLLVPDLAWMLRTIPQAAQPASFHELSPLHKKRKSIFSSFLAWLAPAEEPAKKQVRKIGVFLARPMHAGNTATYNTIVDGLASFLFGLASKFTTNNKEMQSPKSLESETMGKSKKRNLKKKNNKKVYHYLIELVPFQTGHGVLDHENDAIINEDVLKRMMVLNQGNAFGNVALVKQSPSVEDILPLFRTYDFTVCSRFHAHVFSIMAGVPLMSVSCTRKVDVLMSDAQLDDYVYRLPVDEKGRPLQCDPGVMDNVFSKVHLREGHIRAHLATYGDACETRMVDFKRTFANLLRYLPRPVTRYVQGQVASRVSSFIAANHISRERGLRTDNTLDAPVISCLSAPPCDDYIVEGAISRLHLSDADTDRIVRLLSMLLVGKPVSAYSWGLRENLRSDTFALDESCEWIFNHRLTGDTEHSFSEFPRWKRESVFDNQRPTVDVECVRVTEELSATVPGAHRSGWDFVMAEVVKYHDPRAAELFDGYLDETFGWRYEVLRDAGKIPFRRPWKGVLHHTPDQTCSENNLVRLFARKAWRESLATCTGLIVLSENLAAWVRRRLHALEIFNVPVCSMMHPTEFVSRAQRFSWRAYNANDQCKLLQVGGWLRNTFAIYDFPMWITRFGFHKAALQGYGMDHYYLSDAQFLEFMRQLEQVWDTTMLGFPGGGGGGGKTGPHKTGHRETGHFDEDEGREGSPSSLVERGKVGDDMGYYRHRPLTQNPNNVSPWIIGARESAMREMEKKRASVTMIAHVDNAGYDALLRENIVFLNLVDCSAVNTIVECTVRNTPVLVNRLPAVVEYLGEYYPLYYDNLDHAARLLTSPATILQAHVYLKYLDKTYLSVEHFSTCFASFLRNKECAKLGPSSTDAKE